METIISLLDKIRKDYHAYLKEKNLDKLLNFLYGYNDAMAQQAEKGLNFETNYFGHYIENFYGMERVAYKNWQHIIEFFSASEEAAVDKFFEHYNDYFDGNYMEFYKRREEEEYKRFIANGGTIETQYPKTENREPLPFPYEQLAIFRKRPGMYFGRKSLGKMMDYFDGYLYFLKEQTGEEQELIPGFQDFIEKHYKTKKNPRFNHHWSKLIEFFTPNFSGDEAFDEFYSLYDIFLKKTKNKPLK